MFHCKGLWARFRFVDNTNMEQCDIWQMPSLMVRDSAKAVWVQSKSESPQSALSAQRKIQNSGCPIDTAESIFTNTWERFYHPKLTLIVCSASCAALHMILSFTESLGLVTTRFPPQNSNCSDIRLTPGQGRARGKYLVISSGGCLPSCRAEQTHQPASASESKKREWSVGERFSWSVREMSTETDS